jgi:hypothetical protein
MRDTNFRVIARVAQGGGNNGCTDEMDIGWHIPRTGLLVLVLVLAEPVSLG